MCASRKNYERLEHVLRKTLFHAGLTTLILWAFVMTFTPQIMRIFVNPGDDHCHVANIT